MTARRNNIRTRYDDLTAASDNTRVSLPYRIQQRIESEQRRQRVDIREAVSRLRK